MDKTPTLGPLDDVALLDLAADLARAAGAVIMAVRARGFAISDKHDESPVTEADHAAEALIATGLRAATPDIPMIAEEEMAAAHGAGEVVPCPDCQFWLVDPLDGTREFSQLRGEFAVNIGLIRNGRPVLGAVCIPATGELFGGLVGTGAWKRDAGGQHPIRCRAVPDEGVTVLASRSHGNDERLAEFLKSYKVAQTRNMGSAVKFLRVAEGVADLYPRLGRTMEWDSAAPQAVLEAAGGKVCTLDGAPLGYGKPGWDNPHFFCTGL